MLGFLSFIGIPVKNFVLGLASLLKDPAAPGVVTLALVIGLAVVIVVYFRRTRSRLNAILWLRQLIAKTPEGDGFAEGITRLDHTIEREAEGEDREQIATAWREYRETLVQHDEDGTTRFRNSVRPSVFFNADDLHFGAGGWRIVPGLFVSIGLFLTFLGLISALNSMDFAADKVQSSLRELLTIASAKFIMSLTGLFCSIMFTILLRVRMSQIEKSVHDLCASIEKRLTFISLEVLAVEQLRATREQRDHFRTIGMELITELGRPLREELPDVISRSITSAMGPLIQQVGQAGADGMGEMVKDLSARFSDDVGRALAKASESLVQAGDRIAALSDRMDHSSGRVATEMDAAVNRLTQAVEDLRGAMGATAETTSGAFAQGAEQLFAVMNQTLEGIRDNTAEGARALAAAAADMKQAAQGFRSEMELASSESRAATAQAVEELRGAMGATAETASGAFTQGAEQLLAVMNQTLEGIRDNTGEGARALSAAAAEMRQAAQGFRVEIEQASREGRAAVSGQIAAEGANAAGAIGSASVAVIEAMGRTTREISERTEQFAQKAGQELLAPLDGIAAQLKGMVGTLSEGASGMRRLSDGVRAGAEASEQAAGSFRSASQDLVAAVSPIRAANERIEAAMTQLKESTTSAANTVVRSSEATAQSAAQTLAAAQQALGGHARAIETSLDGLNGMLDRLKGQGDRLDDMDGKLGKAFDDYTGRVSAAVESLFGHVRKMQEELAPALDTLRTIVEQAKQFRPESGRRT